MILPVDEEEIELKKRNRQKRLTPKSHKIIHESGRSTKNLWMRIIGKARKVKYGHRTRSTKSNT